jgi:hypothetical protein
MTEWPNGAVTIWWERENRTSNYNSIDPDELPAGLQYKRTHEFAI